MPTKRNTPLSSTTSARGGDLPPPTASEAAFERLLASFDADTNDDANTNADANSNVDAHSTDAPHGRRVASPAVFLDALFAKKDVYLERERYASIGDADDFFTKIVGVSFEGRQDVAGGLVPGQALALVREPDNVHDAHAIAVRFGALPLGFIKRDIAKRIAPNIDSGERYEATVGSVTGGGERNIGVNVHVRRFRRPVARGGARTERTGNVSSADAMRAMGATRDASVEDVQAAFIGTRPLRDAQRDVLECIARGYNTLAVLGTGRGKSLCFTLPAAERALREREKTIVFYPLRALANDQYEALVRRLAPMGLRVLRANGSIDGNERAELDVALETGDWDLVLATPEFVTYHREAFLRPCNRPWLVVVDEAHHIFESKHRAAYGTLGELVRDLGAPQVLALTATANDDAFREIRRTLAIDAWVIDPTVREHLSVVDARGATDKNGYLARELAGDGKGIVYCNSRAEATKLAERLRARLGPAVSFYHAGIPSEERAEIERLFRENELRVVVATSAFGEGIDLPDVRDVVMYHLNFDFTGFNQMAGRAGRDGAPARIHLLYGDGDRRINDFIIGKTAPTLETLREIYRGMRGMARDTIVRTSFEDVARTLDIDAIEGATIAAAVRTFAEGGLVEAGIDDDGRFVRFIEVATKVDLTATARYAEGIAEREAFERFCDLALKADAPTLEQIINRPIYPDRVALKAP